MKIIQGVELIPLKKVVNERGHLMEIQRSDDSSFPGFGQAYITCTFPGVIKAWYRHRRQIDQIALIKGQLNLVLYDTRSDSPTFESLLELNITDQAPSLIQIPPGIWHGFQALGNEATYLIHLNSVAFDFEQTDEERLPSSTLSIPYKW